MRMNHKINFTFKRQYRFECIRDCGMCCHQTGLLLTKNDYERLKSIARIRHPLLTTKAPGFQFEMKLETTECPHLNGTKCSIYRDRPVICRLYPFGVGFSPNGELFVNLTRCPGVNQSRGTWVNEQTLEKILAEIETVDPLFLERLRKIETNIYPQEFFDLKRLLFLKMGHWLFCNTLKGQSIKIKGDSLLHAFMVIWERGELGGSVLPGELHQTISKIEESLVNQLVPSLKLTVKENDEQTKRGLQMNKTYITLDGVRRMADLDQYLDFCDLFQKTIKVKPLDLLKKKETDESAEKMFQEHIEEIMERVGGEGLPIDAELAVVVMCIQRYCEMLDWYSRVYSIGEPEINGRAADLAIKNLDTKGVFAAVVKSVYDEIEQRNSA